MRTADTLDLETSQQTATAEPSAGYPLISVVIPCLNEAQSIAPCVDQALAAFKAEGIHGEVVVSDNGSTDGSTEIAQSHGARVVHASVKGYGAALRAGIATARGQ